MGILARRRRSILAAMKTAEPIIHISDELKALAEANGIDWTKIVGTGKNGEVTLADIEAVLDAHWDDEANHIPPTEEVERPDAVTEEIPPTYEDATPPKTRKTKKDILPQ